MSMTCRFVFDAVVHGFTSGVLSLNWIMSQLGPN